MMSLEEAKASGRPFKRPNWSIWVGYQPGMVLYNAATGREEIGFNEDNAAATDFILIRSRAEVFDVRAGRVVGSYDLDDADFPTLSTCEVALDGYRGRPVLEVRGPRIEDDVAVYTLEV